MSFQNEIINHTEPNATLIAMSMSSGIFNMGIATGTLIGGGICTPLSIAYVGYAASALSWVAVGYRCFRLSRRF